MPKYNLQLQNAKSLRAYLLELRRSASALEAHIQAITKGQEQPEERLLSGYTTNHNQLNPNPYTPDPYGHANLSATAIYAAKVLQEGRRAALALG